MTTFPDHSFEQYYQSIRRLWRFGQEEPVTVDMITTEGELGVLKNMIRKSEQADKMFTFLIQEMKNYMEIKRKQEFDKKMEIPAWM